VQIGVISLRHEITRAAFASGAVELVTRLLTILLSIAVARALDPHDVGLLGLAVIVVGTLSLIAGCAETACVISRARGTDSQYARMAVVIRGAVTGILFPLVLLELPRIGQLVAAPDGTADADLAVIVLVLLWQLVLELAGTYPRVLLQRRLNLTYLSGVSLLQVVAHLVLSVLLLWNGYGVVALAWVTVIAGGLSAVALWARTWREPSLEQGSGGEAGRWKQALVSTAKVFTAGIVGYLNGRLDNVLVATVVGPALMSFYAMAWSASRIPVSALIQGVGVVLVPVLAHLQSDEDRLKALVRESLRHSYLLLAPVAAVLFVSGPSVVAAILGVKWLPLVPCLRIMCLSILMGPLAVVCNAMLVAMGRPHLTGVATGAQLCVIVVLVSPLVRLWGILGAAVADLVSTTVLTLVLFATARHAAPQVKWRFLSAAGVPIVAASSAGLLTLTLGADLPLGLFRFACDLVLISVAYPALVFVLGGRVRLREFATLLRGLRGQAARSRVSA